MSYQAWMDDVKVGDVLRTKRSMRVVRSVTHYEHGPQKGRLKSVQFTIMHCSWTHRCTKVLTYCDLYARGFRPTGVRRKLNSPLDALIAKNLGDRRGPLDCCDVKGVA